MIIIEKIVGMTDTEIVKAITSDLDVFLARETGNVESATIWVHVDKGRREAILNDEGTPLLPGHTAFPDYDEGGVDIALYLLSPDTIVPIMAKGLNLAY